MKKWYSYIRVFTFEGGGTDGFMNRKTKGNLLLLSTAMIWGCAFVAQSVAMDSVGAWTFTCLRNLIAGISLLPLLYVERHKHPQRYEGLDRKELYKNGMYCGVILAIATLFQQYGIIHTTVGKCGFITSLYVIIVPLLETLLGKRFPKKLWVAVTMAIVGFYFLSMTSGNFTIQKGDLLILISSFLFALHILIIDRALKKVDAVSMSCIQFFMAGALCIIPMFLFETVDINGLKAALWPLLYAGVISSGVGYTLQILGQKDADSAMASMILSLESVFSVIAGFIFLHEVLSIREIFGCIIVFIAIVLAQTCQGETTVEVL